jgi:hypothetical protein
MLDPIHSVTRERLCVLGLREPFPPCHANRHERYRPRKAWYLPFLIGALAFLFAFRPVPVAAQDQEEVRRGPRIIYEDKDWGPPSEAS